MKRRTFLFYSRWFSRKSFSKSHHLQRKVSVRSKKTTWQSNEFSIIDEKSFVFKSRSWNWTSEMIEQQQWTIDRFSKSQSIRDYLHIIQLEDTFFRLVLLVGLVFCLTFSLTSLQSDRLTRPKRKTAFNRPRRLKPIQKLND